MASIFKPSFTKADPKTGERIRGQSPTWWIEYRGADGLRHRAKGHKDKSATQQLAADLERRAAREEAGLIDPAAEHAKRPLAEHVAEWHQGLLHRGNTAAHADLSRQRVLAVLAGIRATRWADINAAAVQRYLAERRAAGLSVASSNHHLRAVKSFCGWLVKERRAASNPLAHLSKLNERTDPRHQRRPLSDDELRALLDATRDGPTIYGMPGPDRAMLYELAATSGLRASELASLTARSFELDAPEGPCVRLAAAYSKRRREDVQPIPDATAARLRAFLAPLLPDAKVLLPAVRKRRNPAVVTSPMGWMLDAAG